MKRKEITIKIKSFIKFVPYFNIYDAGATLKILKISPLAYRKKDYFADHLLGVGHDN